MALFMFLWVFPLKKLIDPASTDRGSHDTLPLRTSPPTGLFARTVSFGRTGSYSCG